MINEIAINNFRCFQQITLSDLKRVNVIVGPNGSGKTALMEAIFLATGASPELALRIKAFRGLGTVAITTSRPGYEALWRDLFYRFDQDKQVSISLRGSENYPRELTVSYRKGEPVIVPMETDVYGKEASPAGAPIVFEWTLASGKKISAQPEIRGAQLGLRYSESLENLPVSFYTSAAVPTQEENAGYFSSLSIQNLEDLITEALQSEFPFIKGLSVQVFAATSTVFASVDGLPEKIPVNLLSSGVTKLLSILLGIANQRNGVVCIDELENGFYFDRLPSIWALLLEFASKFNVQLFASTHSWECLEAAADCAADAQDQFAVLQSSSDQAKPGFSVRAGDTFVAAMKQQIDIR